ncbi:MAG: T9SS type A sorting domain-containing protein [Methanosarcina sp.]
MNIPRDSPTILYFRNNAIISKNNEGYMLQAGDEAPASTNNKLDGAVITGNVLRWSGTSMESITHGIFTGHNSNVMIKYNYVDHAPMGIIRKSGNNMSNTSGGVAYNIVKGGAVGIVVKGMSNVNIYNNTVYGDRTTSQTWRPLVNIYTNTDFGVNSVAHGTKIFNNIFYTKYRTPIISIDDTESLIGFQSDYNVFWSEAGSPIFSINGESMTFDQWKAKGYDVHSVVMNPDFKDLINFVPSEKLEFGTDLGQEWAEGLSVDAVWGKSDPATAMQNGKWQAGAVIYEAANSALPHFTSASIHNESPNVIELSFSLPLGNTIPPASAFDVTVNSLTRQVLSVSVAGNKVLLTMKDPIYQGEHVILNYTKPAENALQGQSGEIIPNISARAVINNIGSASTQDPEILIYPNPAKDYITISNAQAANQNSVIKIYNLSGRLYLQNTLNSHITQRVAFNLDPGIYILHLEVGSQTVYIQKLIVIK